MLRRGIRDDTTYGAIATKVAALFAGGKDQSSDEGKAIIKELNDLRPPAFREWAIQPRRQDADCRAGHARQGPDGLGRRPGQI